MSGGCHCCLVWQVSVALLRASHSPISAVLVEVERSDVEKTYHVHSCVGHPNTPGTYQAVALEPSAARRALAQSRIEPGALSSREQSMTGHALSNSQRRAICAVNWLPAAWSCPSVVLKEGVSGRDYRGILMSGKGRIGRAVIGVWESRSLFFVLLSLGRV